MRAGPRAYFFDTMCVCVDHSSLLGESLRVSRAGSISISVGPGMAF